jgi:hypothetical protein
LLRIRSAMAQRQSPGFRRPRRKSAPQERYHMQYPGIGRPRHCIALQPRG